MRARLAIRISQQNVELREVNLKHKPAALLSVSPKATVPVLICTDNTIIDESIDIMHWALNKNDPEHWLQPSHQDTINSLIEQNDSQFKTHLDHYKYADRFPEQSPLTYRQQGETFLKHLEQRLNQTQFLMSDTVSFADIALFPFIRQFALVDSTWFDASPYPKLRCWLSHWLKSELFNSIMQKQSFWVDEQDAITL